MLIQMAWRNLWRNTRRTLITMTAMSLGVAGIVFLQSYQHATFEKMVNTITTGLVGDLQIHGRGYQESPELGNVVEDPTQVEAVVHSKVGGAESERRVVGAGLAGSGDAAAPAMVLGVQPGRSASLRTIIEGKDLSEEGAKEVVLGRGLAEELKVSLGGELVLLGQAVDGSTANDRYTVVGIAATESSDMDLRAVFLRLQDAQDFFGLGDGVHLLVVRLPEGEDDLAQPLSVLRGALDLATVEALSWSEILPELTGMIADKKQGQKAVAYITFLIVALGVLNTTTMSTFERTREFGVMASLGTRPRRILGLVVTEALLTGILSVALGIGIAAAGLYGVGEIHMGTMSQSDILGVRMPSSVPLSLSGESVKSAVSVALTTVLLGSLIPAVRAARLRPADAARFA